MRVIGIPRKQSKDTLALPCQAGRLKAWRIPLLIACVSAAMLLKTVMPSWDGMMKPKQGIFTSATLAFSPTPTDAELFAARVFEEPLVPIVTDMQTNATETMLESASLTRALRVYRNQTDPQDVAPLIAFLQQYPQSRWRASLLLNLRLLYRHSGYITRALAAFEESWALAKKQTLAYPAAIADRAVTELADLNSRLGRMDRLQTLFAEIGTREVRGSAGEKLLGAKEGLATMTSDPGIAFLCGPLALNRVRAIALNDPTASPVLAAARSTQRGTSLTQLMHWSEQAGLQQRMVKRATGSVIPVPAVMHWKVGHFAALVEQSDVGGEIRYRVQDPTFGDDVWVRQAALDEEASGYFLIFGVLPKDWTMVSETEGNTVWGKGYTTGGDPDAYGHGDLVGRACGDGRMGMATYDFHALLAGLHVEDTPVGYTPAYGPTAYFTLSYNQRDSFQEAIPTRMHLGPKWTTNWLSYVQAPYSSVLDSSPADAVALFVGECF